MFIWILMDCVIMQIASKEVIHTACISLVTFYM